MRTSFPSLSLDRYLEAATDTDALRVRKSVVPRIMIATLVPSVLALCTLGSSDVAHLLAGVALWQVVTVLPCFVYILVVRKVPEVMILFFLVSSFWTIVYVDYLCASRVRYRVWPLLVLVLDVILVTRLGQWVTNIGFACCLLWLLVCTMEDTWRIGLYDIGDPDYEARRLGCNCAKPPCPRWVIYHLSDILVTSLVLILDFVCTRGFCKKMLCEQERMKHSVMAAEQITGQLVAFDLQGAEKLLDEAETAIPEDFYRVLHQLLQNLKTYEPFLPQSCLLDRHRAGGSDHDSPASSGDLDSRSQKSRTGHSSMFPATPEVPGGGLGRSFERQVSGFLDGELGNSVKGLLLKSVTLLMLNVRSSHVHLLQQANSRFEDVQLTLLHHSLASIGQTAGIVEYFHGDRIIASWNTSRRCFGHRVKAVTAACSIRTGLEQSDIFSHIAVTSSASMNGNVGCSSMIRYNIVGPIVSLCSAILRLARDWNISLLVDSVVQNDVCISHSTLLVFENIVFRSSIDDEQVILWEVKGEIVNDAEEWMYVAGANHSKQALVAEVIGLAYLKQQPILSSLPTCVTEPQLATVASAVGSPLPPPIVIPAATRRLLTADRTLDNSPAVQSSSGALRLSSVVDVAL